MKRKVQRTTAIILSILMCMQFNVIPAAAAAADVSGGDVPSEEVSGAVVSSGDVSEGDLTTPEEEIQEKNIVVHFQTAYASGMYKTDGDWTEISGSISLVISKGEDFFIAVKTEQPAFISGYGWNGGSSEYVSGNGETTSIEIRKTWEQLNDNDSLSVSFDQMFAADEFSVTLSEKKGTYGYSTEAVLVANGNANLENTEVRWSSNHNAFVAAGQSVPENGISQCTYLVNQNENLRVNAIAQIYRNNSLLCTVTGETYEVIKDTQAPQVMEVQYSKDGKTYYDLADSNFIWSFGEVMFRVKVTDEVEGVPFSGIHKVKIFVNQNAKEMQYNEQSGYYEYTVAPVAGNVFLFKVKVDASDYAGNHTLEDKYPEFGIDRKGPETEVKLMAGGTEVTDWYSEKAGGEALVLEVTATDDNKVSSIEIAVKPDFSKGSMLAALEPIFQDGKYIARTEEGMISGEQNTTYYIRVKDEFGNWGDTIEQQVKIDNTAPSNGAVVGFTGTQNMLVEVENYNQKEQTYVVSKGEGIIYDNDKIALRLVVEDGVTGGKKENVSGIASVDFDVVIENANGTTKIPVHRTEKEFTVNENNEVTVYYDTVLPDGAEKFEQSYRMENIVITDKAGNVCPIDTDVEDALLNDNVLYVVDNKAPEVLYEYESEEVSAANVVEEEGVKTYYYNQEFTGKIRISDMNLMLNSIQIWNMDGFDEAKINENVNASDESMWKNALFTYRISNDGCYQIVTEADDILNNAVKDGELLQTVSEQLIVDTTAPVIEVAVTDGSGQVLADYAGKYYSGDLGASLKITDRNLDLDSVIVTISGRSAQGTAFTQELSKDTWSQNGFEYSNSCAFTQEGSYTVTVQCKDLAGNISAVSTETFYIDKTAPTAAITFDNMNASNGFYYNADRTARIEVKDYSFNPKAANIMIQAQFGNSAAIGEWVHQGADGCQGLHTKDCVYSTTVTFRQDDIYDLAFQCTDMAGNVSEKYDGGHFVVDKTAPVITVSYNNNDVKNEFYYNNARIASVVIDDLSFAGEKSFVSKIDAPGISELPAQSNWQLLSTNKYVKQMNFAQDGIYQYQISATDLAGNQAQVVYSDYFILDLTAPQLEIGGVADRSANNGEVRPVITYADSYLDDAKTVISVQGVQNEDFRFRYNKEEEGNGYRLTGQDFPYTAQTDDLYVLTARIEDYAGNVSEKSIQFSINRFGSVYVLSTDTREWLDGYYRNQEHDIVVTEINVDELAKANVTISRDGEIFPLEESRDYQIQSEGTQDSWKSYTYVISKENFEQEGHYIVTLASEDAAQNQSDNKVKGVEITFAIDKTAPQIVAEGIETGGIYRQSSLEVRTDIQDNMYLNQVTVYVGEQILKEFDQEVLEQNAGRITFEIPETDGRKDIKIVAEDKVGNISEKQYSDVVISTDLKVIEDTMTAKADGNGLFHSNRIYWWILFGLIVLIAAAGGIVVLRKKIIR